MTKKKNTSAASRRAFTQEFRDTAVKLAMTGTKSTAEVARELDIPAWKLYGWMQMANKKLPSKGGAQERNQDSELLKLQKRNRKLKLEVEILKKSDGILRQGPAVKYAFRKFTLSSRFCPFRMVLTISSQVVPFGVIGFEASELQPFTHIKLIAGRVVAPSSCDTIYSGARNT